MKLYDRYLINERVHEADGNLFFATEKLKEAKQNNTDYKKTEETYLIALKQLLKVERYSSLIEKILIPIEEIKKDVQDTFKPYKVKEHALRDLYLKSFRSGPGNLIKGAFFLLCSVLEVPVILLSFILSPFFPKARMQAKQSSLISLTLLCSGVLNVVRGAAKIAAWPLLMLRIAVRGLITYKQGAPKIEDNKGFKELAKQYDLNQDVEANSQIFIIEALVNKYQKGLKRGQKTNIQEEGALSCDIDAAIQRLKSAKNELYKETKQGRCKGEKYNQLTLEIDGIKKRFSEWALLFKTAVDNRETESPKKGLLAP